MRPAELYSWFSEVTTIKGIGDKASQSLARLLRRMAGPESEEKVFIPRLRDVLFHLPVSVIDRRYSPPLLQAEAGNVITALVTVEKHNAAPKRSRAPYRIICSNASGTLTLVYFNAEHSWLETAFPLGAQRIVSGRVELYDGMLQMPHPDIVATPEEREKVMKLEPVYPLSEGLSSRRLAGWIAQAFARVKALPEWLDTAYVKQQGWCDHVEALRRLHYPESKQELMDDAPARLRLAYDELLASQLALALVRVHLKRSAGQRIGPGAHAARVEAALPFALTAGQRRVLADIRADMASGARMLRLLQGDVGSGKTVLALLAGLDVVDAGMQVALMAPTEILARQHAQSLAEILEGTGVEVQLLTGALKASQREKALSRIASGEAHIVVGTHALFQQHVRFGALGLVVIDEQHRFGVAQRMALSGKGGGNPHILLMTATPIPRSLTMTLYGDIDCSALTEKPPGRQEIDTRTLPLSRLAEVIAAVERARAAGAKIYWICPLVEGKGDISLQESADMQAAEDRFAALQVKFGARVGLVHGKMKPEARQKVMQGFSGTEYDILVATTVIEVGVNVPQATVMIIENAERFGLSQLHQLRGRVGRGDKPSTCLLLYHSHASETARERLKIIRGTTDGFTIAEEDLRTRGGGEILGTRQSGMPEFIFADLYAHRDLMKTARDDTKLMLERDPGLLSERGRSLRILLYLFGHDQSVRWLEGG